MPDQDPPLSPIVASGEGLSSEGLPVQSHQRIGRYRISRLLGRGGMSVVYEAVADNDPEPIALKILNAEAKTKPNLRRRFRREAVTIQSLDHPHIVPLRDHGSEDGTPYLAMKLIDGPTLADQIHHWSALAGGDSDDWWEGEPQPHSFPTVDTGIASQPFDPIEVAGRMANAAEALEHAHRFGIVHRDVKPSNLIFDSQGKLWLTDFGLASATEAQTVVTKTGQILGTPHYMSPEQASGLPQDVDFRTDIYSLGATLYECVTLRRPYDGDKFRVLLDIAAGRLTPPSHFRADIPKPLEAILLKAMAHDREDRYGSAQEMADDLRRFVAGVPTTARLPSTADRIVRWVVRRPRESLATLAAVVGIIGIVIALQYIMGQRLAGLNKRLERNVSILADTNLKLEQANIDLDRNRSRLQRHLYVADMSDAYDSFAKGDNDAAQQLLMRQIPEGDETDGRRFEWWLLHHLTRSPASLRLEGHQGAVREARYVPSRNEIVSSSDDGTIRRWDADSGAPIGLLEVPGRLDALDVSPDGERFVTGENVSEGINAVRLRELTSGAVIAELTGHEYSVDSAAFSPDGRWIATGGRYQDILLHSSDGGLAGRLTTGSRNETVAFSKDAKVLAGVLRSGSEGDRRQKFVTWSVPQLVQQSEFSLGLSPSVIALSGDGNWAAAAGQDDFAVIHLDSQRRIRIEDKVRGRIRCVAISHSGEQLAVGCDNGALCHWNFAGVDILENGPVELPQPHVIAVSRQKVTSVSFIQEHSLLTSSEDGSIQIWDADAFRVPIRTVTFATDAMARSCDDSKCVYLRNLGGEIERLNLTTLRRDPLKRVPIDRYGKIAVSPGDRQLVAAARGEIWVLSLPDGEVERRVPVGPSAQSVSDMSFTTDGKALQVLFDDRIAIFDAVTFALQREVLLPFDGTTSLGTSADGQTLVVTASEIILFLDSSTYETVAQVPCTFGPYSWGAGYSRDGRRMAVGHEDGTVIVMEMDRGRPSGANPIVLRGHRSGVTACEFVAEDETLVTASTDATLRFWDIESGRELGVLELPEGDCHYLHYDADHQSLLTGGPHAATRIWSGKPDASNDRKTE